MRSHSMIVGMNIRRVRKSAGWTQEKLAVNTQLSSDYISRLELGKENPTLDVLVRISACLHFEIGELFRPLETNSKG
ncbi:MAG: helix-turn-helix transcriptional regulator [Candidatus Kapabacteria bacterium]|nr:helix-turn-helix transcriptional regulator [Candidatus Kapabacteria bacterium]